MVLVFELMEGGDLHNYLSSRGRTAVEMAIGEDEAKALFYQLLSAISYAHNQHICHRDLKLENILLKEKSLQQVKIADFGLSDFYRYNFHVLSNLLLIFICKLNWMKLCFIHHFHFFKIVLPSHSRSFLFTYVISMS